MPDYKCESEGCGKWLRSNKLFRCKSGNELRCFSCVNHHHHSPNCPSFTPLPNEQQQQQQQQLPSPCTAHSTLIPSSDLTPAASIIEKRALAHILHASSIHSLLFFQFVSALSPSFSTSPFFLSSPLASFDLPLFFLLLSPSELSCKPLSQSPLVNISLSPRPSLSPAFLLSLSPLSFNFFPIHPSLIAVSLFHSCFC